MKSGLFTKLVYIKLLSQSKITPSLLQDPTSITWKQCSWSANGAEMF